MHAPSAILIATALVVGVVQDDSDKVTWRTSLESATAEAIREGLPLLLTFR